MTRPDTSSRSLERVALRRYCGALLAGWTLLVIVLLACNMFQVRAATQELARQAAASSFDKDVLYRRWAAGHGGLYAPVSPESPPNPHLADVPERDITTPSGRELTLINPAYMTRQVHALGPGRTGHRGHITSLDALRPGNEPDDWEAAALRSFAAGAEEAVEVTSIDGVPHLRFMRPLYTEAGCLKCHAQQGYALGDVRGGISVAVPLAPYLARQQQQAIMLWITAAALWTLGVAAGLLGVRHIGRRIRAHEEADEQRRQSEEQLRAEQQRLRESEERYHQLAEQSRTFAWEVDAEGLYTYVSDVVTTVLGYQPEEIVGHRHFFDLHPAAGREEFKQSVLAGMARREEYVGLENPIVAADGRLLWVATNAIPVVAADGSLRGYRGSDTDVSERKKTDRALAAFATVVENSEDIIVVKDLDLRVVATNMAFARAAGHDTVDELIGKTDAEIFGVSEDTEPIRSYMADEREAQKLPRGLCIAREEPVMSPDGTMRYVLTRKYPVYDQQDRLVGTGNISIDITGRKRAEQRLRESEERLALATRGTGIGIWEYRVEDDRLEWDSQMFELYGADRQDFGHRFADWRDSVVPADLPRALANFEKALTGEDEFRIEFPIRRRDGKVRWLAGAATVTRDADGQPVRVVGVNYDITDRKNIEQQLKSALDEQEAILDSSLVGIMVLRNRVLRKVNRRMAEMLGYTPEEIVGRSPRQLHLSQQNFVEFGQNYYWRLAEQEMVQIEYPLRHKDGRTVWCLFNGKAIAPPDLAKGAVWVIEDITERKRNEAELIETREEALRLLKASETAKAELERLNRQLEAQRAHATEMAEQAAQASAAKSEFLANMSHEIRTPMTAIMGFAEVLLESDAAQQASQEVSEAVAAITRNGDYLLRLVNDILDLSKIEAGKLAIEQLPCAPCEIVAEVASLMRVRSTAKGLALSVDYESAIPATIQTDPVRLRQMLINLVGNAIKFTEVGFVQLVVRMVTRDAGDTALEFDIVDSGIGVRPDQAANLFQPFSQADASTTRRFGGTGLGLVITKRLAEALDGDVRLVETRPGAGSRFRVTIATGPLDGVPLLSDPVESGRKAPPAAAPDTTADLHLDCRILLAEDGPDNQRLLMHMLRKAGADVTIVENGKLAVEAALAARDAGAVFDVILMDMQMPVLDGYDATRQLRAAGYAGPIIALTAHAMADDRARCLAAGCDDYASKPIDRGDLIAVIHRHAHGAGTADRAGDLVPQAEQCGSDGSA